MPSQEREVCSSNKIDSAHAPRPPAELVEMCPQTNSHSSGEIRLPRIPELLDSRLPSEIVTTQERHSNTRGFLRFQEIVSVDSMAALTALYVLHGKEFSTERDLLCQVRRDWYLERTFYRNKLSTEPETFVRNGELPTLSFQTKSGRVSIVGIVHDTSLPETYHNLIKEIGTRPYKWITETGLNHFLCKEGATDLHDVRLFSTRDCVKHGLDQSLVGAARTLVRKAAGFLSGRRIDSGWGAKRDIKGIRYHPQMNVSSAELPAFIRLELKLRDANPLDVHERRSAYMAQMLNEIPSEIPKALLVGFDHMDEVYYFLKRPYSDRQLSGLLEKDLSCFSTTGSIPRDPWHHLKSLGLIAAAELCGNIAGVVIPAATAGIAGGVLVWRLAGGAF